MVDPSRTLLITYVDVDGTPRWATGTHLRDDVVLTVAHCAQGSGHQVWCDTRGECAAGSAPERTPSPAQVAWVARTADVAVLTVDGLPAVAPCGLAVVKSRDRAPLKGCALHGFPGFYQPRDPDGRLVPKRARLWVADEATIRLAQDDQQLAVDLSMTTRPRRDTGPEDWGGLSGAAVWTTDVSEQCVGVVAAAERSVASNTLGIVTFDAFGGDDGLWDLVGPPQTVREARRPADDGRPVTVGKVPQEPPAFQRRSAARRAIDGAWGRPDTQAVVICGDGGVGKSQLARAYFAESRAQVRVWADASRLEGVVSAYAEAARSLGLPGEKVIERGAEEFRAWLASTDRSWFVVLDDLAVDPGVFSQWWPPATATGQVLVTTRRHDAGYDGAGRAVVKLDVYTDDEARAYVTRRLESHGIVDAQGEIPEFASGLSFHPVALSVATSVVLDNPRLSVGGFREEYEERLGSLPLDETLPGEDLVYGRSVAATWGVAVERAAEKSDHAKAMAALLSFVHPAGTPCELFATEAARRYLAQACGVFGEVTEKQAWAAFDALVNISLVSGGSGSRWAPANIHALAQSAIRGGLSAEQQISTACAVADATVELWAEDDWKAADGLQATAATLLDLARKALTCPRIHPVLFRAGRAMGKKGQVRQAIAYFRDLLEQSVLGPEHVDTLRIRYHLARWRGEAGDVTGAVAEFEQLLTDQAMTLGSTHDDTLATRHKLAYFRAEAGDLATAASEFAALLNDQRSVCGPGDPYTLTTRWNLARCRGDMGHLAEALDAFETLLVDAQQALGDRHPTTLIIRGNLARCRGGAGDLAGAIDELERLLADQNEVLEPDDPEIFITRGNLARFYGRAGNLRKAVSDFEHLLDDRTRVLGPDHPRTLITRGNLAHWCGEAGNPAAAAREYVFLRDKQNEILGADHPRTLSARGNLARWHAEEGHCAQAVAELESLVKDRTRVLGADHPDTLIARTDAARYRGAAGQLTKAIADLQKIVDDRTHILGPDHPRTLTTRGRLARCRGRAGDVTEAVKDLTGLLVDRLRVLGPDHPSTLITRNDLAYFSGEAGDPTGAITWFENLLSDRLRILGPDHPDTLVTRNDLARFRGVADDPGRAVEEFAALLADRERVLGPEHPHTLITRKNLAWFRGVAGDRERALEELVQLLADRTRILGPDHPNTLSVRGNIARLRFRGESASLDGATTELDGILADRARVLGPDHPHTLVTREDIAWVHGQLGDPTGAVAELESLFDDRRRVLGPKHPRTLRTRGDIAHWRGEAGDLKGAIAGYASVLHDQERALGPHHHHTVKTRDTIARWMVKAGNLRGARRPLETVLVCRMLDLGSDHPLTLAARHEIASLWGASGDPVAAARELARVLADRRRVLGGGHRDTQETEENLARVRQGLDTGRSLADEARDRTASDGLDLLGALRRQPPDAENGAAGSVA